MQIKRHTIHKYGFNGFILPMPMYEVSGPYKCPRVWVSCKNKQ